MKRNKIALMILLIIIVCISGVFIYFTFLTKKTALITQDSLSPRAQEFVDNQSSDGTGLWSRVRLKEATASESADTTEGSIETNCFNFSVPFKVLAPTIEMTEDRCTWKAKIISPHGLLIISRYKSDTFNEDTGIILRKNNSEKYQEVPVSISSLDEAIIFRSNEDLTAFAMKRNNMITVSITNMTQPDAMSLEHIKTILNTLTVDELVSER